MVQYGSVVVHLRKNVMFTEVEIEDPVGFRFNWVH